ncbi:hypothetical protein FB45DRAFT_914166 [Roridomyces roridus]|uniref:Uncharacterized protein n=1 Tax=Roridomyces roridus TaxID=1738132 RepID=A0AAD7FR84_9AGAR|nr:hypothetical protein FB45DRAFT_914166 [Roridomyces roridus]
MARGPPSSHHTSSSPEGPPVAHRRVSSVVEFDMRMPNKFHHHQHFQDDGSSGSEPRSATSSVFDAENMSYSSESSGSTFPNPLSRSASEFDLRMVNNHGQMQRYRHNTLPVLESNDPHHSPAASINSLTDLSSPGMHPIEIAVPQINGSFGNPWAQPHEEQQQQAGVTVHEVELMYSSPVTPINLGSAGGEEGFYEYMPRVSPSYIKEERRETAPAAFQLLSSPLSEGTLMQI